MKEYVPYVNTKVTQEDVDRLKIDLHKFDFWVINHGGKAEHDEELKTIDRMWQEIEDLRSIIQKQIY